MPLLIPALISMLAYADKPAEAAGGKHVASEAANPVDDRDVPASEKPWVDAYRRYSQSMLASLRGSKTARDRMLSTHVAFMNDAFDRRMPAPADRLDRGRMLREAARDAPDDPLVQWVWANTGDDDSGCSTSDPCPERRNALVRLQPANGASWLPVFGIAWEKNDVPTADAALRQMAQATYFDEQQGLALASWMAIYRRFPVPPASQRTKVSTTTVERTNFRFAENSESSMSVEDRTSDALHSLASACAWEERPKAPPLRFRYCAQVGRLMMTRSKTFMARSVGRIILERSGLTIPADRALARANEWQNVQKVGFSSKVATGAPEMDAFEKDWVSSGDEVQATQRQLKRAGIPLVPPSDFYP
jgi:hypothetical protein